MKETVKTSRTAGYLEKMFRELNRDYFGDELEEPIITIQATPRAYGHVSVSKVWKRKGENRHELNIDAGTLQRPIEDICATLLHEMTHLYNMAHGIQDCSRGGSYHNAKFKAEAERHGIHVEKHPKYGWTVTSPTDELLEYILEHGWCEISMQRGGGEWMPPAAPGRQTGASAGAAGAAPRTSSTRKYICPCCKQSIRATKTVNIICGNCLQRMVEAV